MKTEKAKHRLRPILLLALLTAMSLHLLAFWSVQGMEIPSSLRELARQRFHMSDGRDEPSFPDEWIDEALATTFANLEPADVWKAAQPPEQVEPPEQRFDRLLASSSPVTGDYADDALDFDITASQLSDVTTGITAIQVDASGAQWANGLLSATAAPEARGVAMADWVEQPGHIATSDDFGVDVDFAHAENGQGVLFRIQVAPVDGRDLKKIHQNFFFLLDRSASIKTDRYEWSKQAIIKALDHLEPDQCFNVIVFDHKVDTLFEVPQSASASSLEIARKFLLRSEAGGFFSGTDLYASLDRIIPKAVGEHEVNTVLLLSDGDTFQRKGKQRRAIAEWTQQNDGRVALYAVATGERNNLPLMAILSAFNKGSLVYSAEPEGLPSELSKLVRRLSRPLGKQMHATIIPADPEVRATVYPKNTRLPDLFAESPYVVSGSLEKPCDFYVFLQGRFYDHWVEVERKISVPEPIEHSPQLQSVLVTQRAYDYYDRYLQKGDLADLDKANKMISTVQSGEVLR